MNLQTHIRTELWNTLSNSYDAENYKNAILDAMHFLSNTLRDKSGIDGDGVSLVGQALSGESPKLKLNKLQTETEQNQQRGYSEIIRGLYRAIRNPRSHETIEDTKETADSLIFFINHIINILDESRPPFTIQEFLIRVTDPDFVESDRYADLLTSEIPPNKLLEALIEIYRNKTQGESKKLRYIVDSIIKLLSEDQIKDFCSVVSEELKLTQDSGVMLTSIQLLPPEQWPNIEEAPRMRVENKLIQSIELGEVAIESGYIRGGHFGTWANRLVPYFTMKDQLTSVLIRKLRDSDGEDVRYVVSYFLMHLPFLVTDYYDREICIEGISREVKSGHRESRRIVYKFINNSPEDWKTELLSALEDVTDPDNPEYYTNDGLPFLGKIEDYVDDSIPF